jgi:hypothetical protein
MKRIILTTGAPLLMSPIELHVFMQIIRPDLMPTFFKFASRYCDPVKKQEGIHFNGASFSDELELVFYKRFAIRRKNIQT